MMSVCDTSASTTIFGFMSSLSSGRSEYVHTL